MLYGYISLALALVEGLEERPRTGVKVTMFGLYNYSSYRFSNLHLEDRVIADRDTYNEESLLVLIRKCQEYSLLLKAIFLVQKTVDFFSLLSCFGVEVVKGRISSLLIGKWHY